VLIVFYQAIMKLMALTAVDGVAINSWFSIWNLVEKDKSYILPVVAGLTQFMLSLMISKGAQVRDIISNKQSASKEIKEANKQEENTAQMAASMQKQMMLMMPIMTVIIGLSLPAGVILYWIVGTIFSIFQQAAISGWGNLAFWKKNTANIK
jgi:YidC/Oxa1 family membrane protein insertase